MKFALSYTPFLESWKYKLDKIEEQIKHLIIIQICVYKNRARRKTGSSNLDDKNMFELYSGWHDMIL